MEKNCVKLLEEVKNVKVRGRKVRTQQMTMERKCGCVN
jgi:hypothetical protein